MLAPQIPDPQLTWIFRRDTPNRITPTWLRLRSAIQEIAGRCLFNPSQPSEYTLAFILTCLGALKFTNLDAHQKHLLYLTAAWLQTT